MLEIKFWEYFNLPKISYKLILLCLIFSFGLRSNAEYSSNDYVRREHSLAPPFTGVGINLPHWDFVGHTMITNKYIRLTPNLQSKSGAIWNTVPVYSVNWEIIVHFKVHGTGSDLFGDGFAIWYTKEKMKPGPVFGSINYFSGLAIILDTYSNHNGLHNHQHPYISAMVNNGTLKYDHDLDGTHTQLDGCEARFRNVNYETKINIQYRNDVLKVSTNLDDNEEWKKCFEVEEVKLPTGYFLGVSATTGDLSDNHDIISVKFYDLDTEVNTQLSQERMKIIPSAKRFAPPRERVEDVKPGMSNIKIFFLLLFGMLSAIAITIFVVSWYKEKNSRKHFY